jgi:hypothetical protein
MKRFLILLLLLAVVAPGMARAQTSAFPAPQNDVIVLDHWRTHSGDNLAWANPNLDDSQWQTGNAPTKDGGLVVKVGFEWYRTTVTLPEALQGREIAIGMGTLGEVYDLYVEGVLIGRFGHWTPKPESPFDRDVTYPVPHGIVKGAIVHIAIRQWMGNSSTSYFPFYSSGAARFPRTPELGLLSTVTANTKLYTFSGVVRNLPWNLCLLSMLGAGCVAFVLFSAQRARAEYLVLGIYCIGSFLAPLAGGILAANDSVMRRSWGPVMIFLAFGAFNITPLLFLSRLCLRFRRELEIGTALSFASYLAIAFAFATQASFTNNAFWTTVSSILPTLFYLLAALGLLMQREVGSIAIGIALLLQQLATAWVNSIHTLFGMSDLRFMPLGPLAVDLRAIAQALFVFITWIVLYLRYRQEQLRQVALEQDMASARRMQEQLLGGSAPRVPGFDLAAVYLPAQEVGGDFYRTVPLHDGSLLVIVGDVSGKGLDAAMLVAAVLGSLANEVERSPGSLLEYLNHAVTGRTGGGFITACCARFFPDGKIVVANAGHISPYLNGRELELENGLPLGISAEAEYMEAEVRTSGAVTFMSDGVVEARNAKGELLGFERMAALTSKTAAEIAEAAQRWGQEDDITVLTVGRMAAV